MTPIVEYRSSFRGRLASEQYGTSPVLILYSIVLRDTYPLT